MSGHINPERMMKALTSTLAALALGLAMHSGHAAQLVSQSAAGQSLAVNLGSGQVGLDITFKQPGSVSFTLALEAADLGQWLRFNAVVGNQMAQGIASLVLMLQDAEFAEVGSVSAQFGSVADVAGSSRQQTILFSPAETLGVDLGAPFARPGTRDWLLAADGLAAGDRFTVTINAVPEPAPWALMALCGWGLARSRRGRGGQPAIGT